MVFPIFKVLAGFSIVLGTGGAGLAGTYALTKKTILDGLENKRPVSTEGSDTGEAWTKLVTNLKSENVNKLPKSNKFEEVKKQTTQDNEPSKLKSACGEASIEIYSTIFYKNDDLLNDFKKFCVISLGDMLGDSKKFTFETSDKEKLKARLTILQSHSGIDNGNLEENKDLKDLKEKLNGSITAESPEVTELFKWCKDHYESSYVNDSDNLKKLVYKYCDKSQT